MNQKFRLSFALIASLSAVSGAVAVSCGGGSSNSHPATPVSLGGTMTATDNGTTVTTKLPVLPRLTNVVGTLRDDSVGIDFDPVDGALDYRVYPLPDDGDITAFSDGSLTVKNAIYRCAGMRQTYDLRNSLNAGDPDLFVFDKLGTTATIDPKPERNTLGYVYLTKGAGRIPVYALANYASDGEEGWRASRVKVYTTHAYDQQRMLAAGWRDDGIVFYVPAATGATTHTLFGSEIAGLVAGQGWLKHQQYYFTSDAMSAHTGDTTPPAPAFEVLNAAAGADTKPLMAVLYQGTHIHVELLAGQERFKRAAYQGTSPDWHVEWSGLTGDTTLVVEALKNGCPFQGYLSPQHLEASEHQTFLTLDELQQASPTGEVFINGQYDKVVGNPMPIARSFLKVTPAPHKAGDWDWYQGFNVGSDLGAVTEVAGCTDLNCARWQTNDLDITAYRLDKPGPLNVPVIAFGQFLGQFWESFDDSAHDVTGKIRISARTKARIDADPNKYLHATMSVDIVSTDRRYPQLLLTDQDIPVQEGLKNPASNNILIQPILGPSMRLEVQAFHGLVPGLVGSWDVNNQAAEHRLIDYDNEKVSAQPNDAPFEHASMDRLTRFDAFISSQRIYVFMDNQPAGCVLLPSAVKLSGPVTYTVGDVLYHEGAADELVCDQARPYTFMHAHQCVETKRHFDDLAFKNGVAPPAWDDKRFPCLPY
ncbi:MAG: hypothetical protein ABI548_14570 [Polyangiaceae bacterium]